MGVAAQRCAAAHGQRPRVRSVPSALSLADLLGYVPHRPVDPRHQTRNGSQAEKQAGQRAPRQIALPETEDRADAVPGHGRHHQRAGP